MSKIFNSGRQSMLSTFYMVALSASLVVFTGAETHGQGHKDSSSKDSSSRDTGAKNESPRSSRDSAPSHSDSRPAPRDSGSHVDRSPSTSSGSSSHSDSRPVAPRESSPRADYGRTQTQRDPSPRDSSESSRLPNRESSPRDNSPRIDTGRAPSNSSSRDLSNSRPNYRDNSGQTSVNRASNENITAHPPTTPNQPVGSGRTVSGGNSNDRAPINRTFINGPRDSKNHDLFTQSRDGRTFGHGAVVREAVIVRERQLVPYFPHGYAYYPYYAPTFTVGVTFWSPYSYYYGVCAPYVYRSHCIFDAPRIVFVEIPVYDGAYYRPYRGDGDYYLSNRSINDINNISDSSLRGAVEDLRDAFRLSNINALANLIDPNVKVAVFLKGKYDYSLVGNDYLDMTRDMLRSTDTIQFDLTRIQSRAEGVYVVSGKHVYVDHGGQRHAVYLSFVLERLGGRWTLTQVGTSPDRIQEPR